MATSMRSQLKMSEESFDFICNACEKVGKTVEAVKYCVECAGYCCQPCTDIHIMFPALKNHNLMEVDKAKQASGHQTHVLEFPTERCSIHKGKVVDMFCESHEAVGCYVCMGIDHKMCQQHHIHSIPDMIETIFKPSECKQIQRLLKDADQSLMDFMKGLRGIGRVQKNEITHDPSPRPRHELYKVKNSRDINIKLPGDSNQCYSNGSCLTQDDQLLVTDCNNKKLLLIDIQKMSVVDYCYFDSNPCGVCSVSKYEVAVACYNNNTIKFVSICNKMSVTRTINMSHFCYGIGYNDNKLFVTDVSQSLYVYNMTGTLLNTITHNSGGKGLFDQSRYVASNEQGTRMYVGCWNNGVVCFDGAGNYISAISCADQRQVDGVCVDNEGNLFVVDYNGGSIHQYNSEDGRKVGVIVLGLQSPRSVCFHAKMKKMFVTISNSDVMRMYELE